MRSYINTLVDYREAPFEKNVTLRCPEEHIQSQIRHLTRSYKKTENVQKIETGDVVLLSLESEMPKFNRPMVPVTVGGNLFDAEFEKQLAGHTVGETFTVTVQDKPVTVTVKQASRTVFPEATDEMAAAYAAEHEEFSNAVTVEKYRSCVIEKYIAEQKQQILFSAMDAVSEYVLTNSDFNFSEDEISERMDKAKKEICQSLKDDGKDLELLTAEELDMYFGISSLTEFEKALKTNIEWSIASDLWLLAIHQKDSVDQIGDDPWAFLQEYVEENLNITEEK